MISSHALRQSRIAIQLLFVATLRSALRLHSPLVYIPLTTEDRTLQAILSQFYSCHRSSAVNLLRLINNEALGSGAVKASIVTTIVFLFFIYTNRPSLVNIIISYSFQLQRPLVMVGRIVSSDLFQTSAVGLMGCYWCSQIKTSAS